LDPEKINIPPETTSWKIVRKAEEFENLEPVGVHYAIEDGCVHVFLEGLDIASVTKVGKVDASSLKF
tara:strand:+ start:652 stop:852 length:201 start_codon:yes stop_codon:yes gene_type:complete